MIFPPSFPAHIDEPAEEQVYHALKKLDPERYDVFYGRRFAGMKPGERKEYEIDFIIADLGGGRCNGILVLEVKGGLVKFDGVTSTWTQNGRPMKGDDPVAQAQGNMHSLLRHYPDIGRHVPFGWALCFPDPRNAYSMKQLPPFLNPLQLFENFVLGTLDKHLPQVFALIREQNPHCQGASLEQYRLLRESLLSGLGHVVPLHLRFAAQERRLIKLTEDQMRLLELVRENDCLQVTGPAGCGKTVMATTLARQAREEGLKVLLLTFNRIPAANIREGFGLSGQEDDITVENYHRFARQQIEKAEPGWWDEHVQDEDFWELESAARLHEVLQKQEPAFDVLIIDEAQDFREMWFESLERVLKPGGRYYLFMDEDQNIFEAFTTLPPARHFTRFRLPHNCRNTVRIIERLEGYIGKNIPYLEGTPEGEPVKEYTYKNDIEQARMIKDEWLRMVRENSIGPDRIVILLNTHLEESCLKDMKAFGPYPIEPISKETGHISPKHVNITTIRTFKGLEADVVFIVDTDKMPSEDQRVLYTQASRARLWLGVFKKDKAYQEP